MKTTALAIIGGGPAGMAAAAAAYNAGITDIIIFERDERLGGILNQCIHNGFGLHRFGEELTGPEYAGRYERAVRELPIEIKLNTMALDITPGKIITYSSESEGTQQIQAKAIILAMGCRERPRGALNIPGTRPAGVYTAGTAQKFINIKGHMPGKEAVILGSGDIGLIMARRMTLEGAKVKAVCELMPYSGGLTRNIVQCLNDFDIPLMLSHTVVKIHGEKRVTGVTIAKVDDTLKPIAGTEEFIPCDTLLLSVGLLPENELSKSAGVELSGITGGAVVDQNRQTSVEGIFSCGNVLHVHDLVDFVSEEAELAGISAANYIQSKSESHVDIEISAGLGVRYTVPKKITSSAEDVKIYFRVREVYNNAKIYVKSGDTILAERKKQRLAPGEMEHIVIRKEMLMEADRIEVSVSCN